jgi:hypothetical protein
MSCAQLYPVAARARQARHIARHGSTGPRASSPLRAASVNRRLTVQEKVSVLGEPRFPGHRAPGDPHRRAGFRSSGFAGIALSPGPRIGALAVDTPIDRPASEAYFQATEAKPNFPD